MSDIVGRLHFEARCMDAEYHGTALLLNAAADEIERLRKALTRIAFLRPAGATPKMVKGELVEQIERIALTALEDHVAGVLT